MPYRITTEAAQNPKREAQIIACYRAGMILREIGKAYGISAERVRQLIVRYEARTSVKLKRHKNKPLPNRVKWQCEMCGKEVMRILSQAKKYKLCRSCARFKLALDPKIIESWIAARRAGSTWREIAIQSGYNKYTHSEAARATYSYLRRNNRLNEVRELWKGYSLRWLARLFPKDVELLSNDDDGRHMNRKKSVAQHNSVHH